MYFNLLQDFGSPTKKRDFDDNKVDDTLSPASQDEEEEDEDMQGNDYVNLRVLLHTEKISLIIK